MTYKDRRLDSGVSIYDVTLVALLFIRARQHPLTSFILMITIIFILFVFITVYISIIGGRQANPYDLE